MAQNKVYLTVLLALLVGCAVLTGCAGEGAGDVSRNVGNNMNPIETIEDLQLGKFPGLDAETEARILRDYFNTYIIPNDPDAIIDYTILRYLGTYNGCVVIQFPYAVIAVVWGEEIDGIRFHDASPPGITVWKDGVFYTMTALYEQGLLTREDLLTISGIHEELKAAYFGENRQQIFLSLPALSVALFVTQCL